MAMSRRKTLALVGGGLLTTSVVSLGGFMATRTPTHAREPWHTAGTYDDPRLFALSYAVLAPNPHNIQPWLVDVRQADKVLVYRDLDRTLPETDPYARQLTIGLGCFLELMAIAASQAGYQIDFDWYPEGESGPVSVAHFRPGGTPDELFHQILDRRSCKEAFEDKAVPTEIHNRLAAFGNLITEPKLVDELRQLTLAAWEVELTTPATLQESVDLMRFGKAEINRNPDGIDISGTVPELLMLAGVLDAESQADINSPIYKESMRRFRELMLATPAYITMTSATNTRRDQIDIGRRWLRLNLTTTAMGLALHPVSQALQEFPEMQPHYEKVHRLLAEPGYTVQMLGRLGFGPKTPPSPRWAIETRIQYG